MPADARVVMRANAYADEEMKLRSELRPLPSALRGAIREALASAFFVGYSAGELDAGRPVVVRRPQVDSHVTKVTDVETLIQDVPTVVGARWQCICGAAREFIVGQEFGGESIASVGRARGIARGAAFVHCASVR